MMMSSDQILSIFSRLCGHIFSVQLIFMKLKVHHIYCSCNYFVNSPTHVVKTSLVKLVLFHPLNIFLPYKTFSNPMQLLKLHEIMKLPKICNDILEFIWINPYSVIIFLCCTQINRNMRILHVWIFRKMYWSAFCLAYGAKFCYRASNGWQKC